MAMTKERAKVIAADVAAALAAVAAKHGLTVEVSGGTFDGGMFKPRVTFKDADGQRAEFVAYATSLGMRADDYGRTFSHGGATHTVVAINLGARTKPVVTRTEDGRVYNWPVSLIAAVLGKA